MLSLTRGAIQAHQNSASNFIGLRRTAATARKSSKHSSSFYRPRSIAVRSYARWAKIVSKIPADQLAKMRNGTSGRSKAPQQNLTIRTSNTVGDPWLAPRMSSPFASKVRCMMESLLSHAERFWKDMFEWGKHAVMSYVGSAYRIRNASTQLKVPKIGRKDVKKAAIDTYIKYNQTLSRFHITGMSSFVSDHELTVLRNKFGKTALPPNNKPVWEHQNLGVRILNFAVLQAPAPLNLHFIQATVRITGNQKFAVFDPEGKVVLGDDSFKPVQDIWVLEKILERPESPWIVVASHLDHPDDVAAAAKSQ